MWDDLDGLPPAERLRREDRAAREHRRIAELLPWYCNGRLDDVERRRVDEHLEECGACRAELESCRRLGELLHADAEATPALHPAQVQLAIDRALALAPVPASRFARVPRAARWIMAGQLAALLLLGIWVAGGEHQAPAAFHTLSEAAKPVPAQALRVVFAADAPESEIRRLLLAVHGRIVDGPSSYGVYTLSVSGELPGGEAAALTTLRGDARVRFAEPVGGGR